jgi:hypothetical protein
MSMHRRSWLDDIGFAMREAVRLIPFVSIRFRFHPRACSFRFGQWARARAGCATKGVWEYC